MSFRILVDDEPDVAEMFRQRFRRKGRQGTYVLHLATSGEEARGKLANGVQSELTSEDRAPANSAPSSSSPSPSISIN
jgi:hypothetical protein